MILKQPRTLGGLKDQDTHWLIPIPILIMRSALYLLSALPLWPLFVFALPLPSSLSKSILPVNHFDINFRTSPCQHEPRAQIA